MTDAPSDPPTGVPTVPEDDPATPVHGAYAASPRTAAAAPGTVIDRYTVLERLGAGSMGEVYAAYDTALDRKVALKLLHDHGLQYEARLTREAQAMARLLHPDVVAVFDVGIFRGRPYLAMEFVRGSTLRKWRKAQPRSVREIVRVYREAGLGLAAAHQAGIVHRDFKPDNVLVADDGRVKVTDFGIARGLGRGSGGSDPTPVAVSSHAARPVPPSDAPDVPTAPTSARSLDDPLTQEGALLGTPGYMAPEQYLGEEVDERTDQFAFCVSLYEALYGRRPFGAAPGGVRLADLGRATIAGELPPPPKGTSIPAHLQQVLARGLRSDPEQRYPSMQALLADLGRDPVRNRRRTVAAAAVVLAAVVTAGSLHVAEVRRRSALRAECASRSDAMTGTWNDDRRAKLRAALLADGTAAADRTDRTLATLDRFAQAWKGEELGSCTATLLDATQTRAVYDERSDCLLGARQAFDVTVDILSENDPRTHRRAVELVESALLPPGLCTGREAEHSYTPLPSDPARRDMAQESRRLCRRARVDEMSGRSRDAIAAAERALDLARSAGTPGDEARAHLAQATSFLTLSEPADGIAHAQSAVEAAERAGDDTLGASAAATLAFALSEGAGRSEEARSWMRLAWAKLARAGSAPLEERQLWVYTSVVESNGGDLPRALDADAHAIDLARELLGDHSVTMCGTLNGRAIDRVRANDPVGALADFRQAAECEETETGPTPTTAIYRANVGECLLGLGQPAEAIAQYRRAMAMRAELGPRDNFSLGYQAHVAIAEADLGRYDDALADARQVISTIEQASSSALKSREAYATALFAVGTTELRKGDAKAAKASCERAAAKLDELGDIQPEEVDPFRCAGEADLALGDAPAARVILARAERIAWVLPGELAQVRAALARALGSRPSPDPSGARALMSRARDDLARDVVRDPGLQSPLAAVDAWLQDHGGAASP